jgi:hypothetical protein
MINVVHAAFEMELGIEGTETGVIVRHASGHGLQYRYGFENSSSSVLPKIVKTKKIGRFLI